MQSGQALGDFLINMIQSIWFFTIFTLTSIGLFAALDWRLALLLIVWFAIYFLAPGKDAAGGAPPLEGDVTCPLEPQRPHRRQLHQHSDGEIVRRHRNRRHASGATHCRTCSMRARAFTRLVSGLRITLAFINGLLITGAGLLGVWLWQIGSISVGAVAIALALVLRINNMSGWMMFQFNGIFRDLGTLQDSIATVSVPIRVRDKPGAIELTVSVVASPSKTSASTTATTRARSRTSTSRSALARKSASSGGPAPARPR